jgi:hypothetical protein
MPALTWLLVAIVAGAGAYAVGWPAWRSYRARETRDLNTERYLAWRGRASRPSSTSTREGMTGEERRRIYAAVGLAALSTVGLIAFLVTS